jgi:hypothetical protein
VRVVTDHPTIRELTASIMAIVLPEVQVIPTQLQIRGAPGTVMPRASVLLVPGSEQNYQITAVEPPVPGVRVEHRQTSPGSYRIDLLEIPAGPALDGRALIIRTTLPRMAEIAVPLRYVPPTGP